MGLSPERFDSVGLRWGPRTGPLTSSWVTDAVNPTLRARVAAMLSIALCSSFWNVHLLMSLSCFRPFDNVPFSLAIGVPDPEDPYHSAGSGCHLALAQPSSLSRHYSVLPSRLRPFCAASRFSNATSFFMAPGSGTHFALLCHACPADTYSRTPLPASVLLPKAPSWPQPRSHSLRPHNTLTLFYHAVTFALFAPGHFSVRL